MSGSERHALHGVIIEKFKRAPAALIERFRRHDTAKVVDSMAGYGAMDYEIKPLEPSMRVVGSALTVLTRPGDALYVQKAIDLAREAGANGVSLTSNPQRAAANQLYVAMGFELRKTNPYFYKLK